MLVNLVTAVDKSWIRQLIENTASKAGGHAMGDFKVRLFAQPSNVIVRGLRRIDVPIVNHFTNACQPPRGAMNNEQRAMNNGQKKSLLLHPESCQVLNLRLMDRCSLPTLA
jgi:hypothetical protein